MAETISELKIIDNPNYKKIGKEYLKALSKIQSQKEQGVKREVIIENAQQNAAKILKQVSDFREQELNQIYSAMDMIKDKYKPVIEDPTKEILKRQDIELRLKTMSDGELIRYVGKLSEYAPSLFELQTLQLLSESKSIDVKQSINNSVLSYKFAHNPGEEWRNDETYKALQYEINEIGWIPTEGLYYRPKNYTKETIESTVVVEGFQTIASYGEYFQIPKGKNPDFEIINNIESELIAEVGTYN